MGWGEEEGEAGDGVEEEGAGDLLLWEEVVEVGHPEFQVWMEEGEEEPKLALWKEEAEEVPLCPLWREGEVVVELRCEVVVEEEEGHLEKGVEGELEGKHQRQLHQRSSSQSFINAAVNNLLLSATCVKGHEQQFHKLF